MCASRTVKGFSGNGFYSRDCSATPAAFVMIFFVYSTCVIKCCCCFQEDSDLLGLRLFVDEQSRLLRDFSEKLEQSVSTLKQDVAAIVRRKRERSGIWS